MEERGITMKTEQWGERGVTMETAPGQHTGGEGCYHGDSTMGRRGVTMKTEQWGRVVLPWRKNILKTN